MVAWDNKIAATEHVVRDTCCTNHWKKRKPEASTDNLGAPGVSIALHKKSRVELLQSPPYSHIQKAL